MSTTHCRHDSNFLPVVDRRSTNYEVTSAFSVSVDFSEGALYWLGMLIRHYWLSENLSTQTLEPNYFQISHTIKPFNFAFFSAWKKNL